MPELRFEEHVYQVDDFDTVLNTLLKNGHAIPNFCRGGICHSCMMKAEEGIPLPFTQIGLKDELVEENYFLTCQCAVYAPMTIRRPDKDKRTRFVAMVREKSLLADNVVKILLSPEHEFVYQAGQFTTLINVDGLKDDFAIASIHGEGNLMEFHILDDPQKPLNQYLVSELEVGDGLEIQTALGDCYYDDEMKAHQLIVVAVDTGLASGLSVIKKALQENHPQAIHLLFAQLHTADGYFAAAIEPLTASEAALNCESIGAEDTDSLVASIGARLEQLATSDSSLQLLMAADPAMTELMTNHAQSTAIACRSIGVG